MISVVVLSHNNETSIAKTLESLSWADELILLDDYSTDQTVRIAKKYTSHIHKRHVDGDFAAQRNAALDFTEGEWILFVDSDEIVPQALANEMREAIEKSQGEHSGFMLRRTDFFMGQQLRFGETSQVRLLRLAKRKSGAWKRPVHEYWDIQGPKKELLTPLLHYSHSSVSEFIDDINHYSTINAQYLYRQKVRVPAWHILAYPKAKFWVDYIWYLGFLDGLPGMVFALLMSFHSFLTRGKLYLLWKHHERAS